MNRISSVAPNSSKSKTFSSWLGTAEVVLGAGALGVACYFSLTRGESLCSERYVPGCLMAIFCLILPGWLLRSSSSMRWLGQLLPVLAFTCLFLFAYAMSRF